MKVVQKFWADLPRLYKYNHSLRRFDDQFVNWDCSVEGFEGVLAQDILPELIKRFSFEVFLAFSNVIDIFIDRSFGDNFNHELPWDCAQLMEESHWSSFLFVPADLSNCGLPSARGC
jgi:hypothetical protein